MYEPGSYNPLARIDGAGRIQAHPAAAHAFGHADLQQGKAQSIPTTNARWEDAFHAVAGPIGTVAQFHAREKAVQQLAEKAAHEASDQPEDESLQPKGEDADAQVYYFHTQANGLPEELTDKGGNIAWRAQYKTWGNTAQEEWQAFDGIGRPVGSPDAQPVYQPASSSLPSEQNLRMQGQYLDRETGLHYNTFRFYDPDLGAFITSDPIGLAGGTNLHSYAPNPISWIDPWGWSCIRTNAANGKTHGDLVTKTAEAKHGAGNVKSEVYIRPIDANGKPVNYRVRLDNTVTAPSGTVPTKILEAKGSATAPLTKNQTKGYPLIKQNGGIIEQGSGKNKVTIPIPPTPVQIVRPGDLGKI